MDLGQARFGLYLRPTNIREQIRHAKVAEKYGWDSVWKQDHFSIRGPTLTKPEVWSTLLAAGLSTITLHVGSCCTCQHRAHPVKLAQTIASVDQAVKGRVLVGIGAGEAENVEPIGLSTKGWVERLREVIEIMKALWAREEGKEAYVNYDGQFFNLSKSYIQETPYQKGGPPVFIGAFGPKMLRLVGEIADGWIPFAHSPETYRDTLNGPIKKAAEAAGRSLTEIYPCHESGIKIGDDDSVRDAALFEARRILILNPAIFKQVLPGFEHPGWQYTMAYGSEDVRDPQVLADVADQIPEELALKHTFWGTPDELIETTEQFLKVGCQHFVWGPRDPSEVEPVVKIVGKKIIPYFKDHR